MTELIDLAKAMQRGAVVAYPTDTAYGLGVVADNVPALEKLFKIKGRAKHHPVSLVVGSLKQAQAIARLDKRAQALWRKFMPGALTIVVPLKPELKNKKAWKILTAGTGQIGLRLPNHPIPIKLARLLKKPITTTSANLSGRPSCYSPAEIIKQFSGSRQPDLIVGGGKLKPGRISTVVDLSGTDARIIREGSLPAKQILKALKQIE